MKLAWDSGPIYIYRYDRYAVHARRTRPHIKCECVCVCAWISILIGLQGMNPFRVVWHVYYSMHTDDDSLVLPLSFHSRYSSMCVCMCARASVWVFSASEFFFSFFIRCCLGLLLLVVAVSSNFFRLSLSLSALIDCNECYFVTISLQLEPKNRGKIDAVDKLKFSFLIELVVGVIWLRLRLIWKSISIARVCLRAKQMCSFGSSPADRERNSWNENKNIYWNDIVASGWRRRGCVMETGRRSGGPGLCWWWLSCCFLAATCSDYDRW